MILEDGARRADVLVRDGRIVAVGDVGEAGAEDEVFDATGLFVLPGLIDFHVHVADRIGDFELADDFLSASRAAVRTGITTLIAFATQPPGRSLHETLEDYLARGARGSFCDYHFHLTPTRWDDETRAELDALVERGFRTLKLYTTYREAGLFSSYERFARILEHVAARGMRVLVHCEDQGALDRAAGRGTFDASDPRGHASERPAEAEVLAIEKLLELAADTGASVYVVHVSTAAGAERLRAARAGPAGDRITFETAPQYLLLEREALAAEDGHRLLCTPPLRDETDRARLEELAATGEIPILATDHCPFPLADKDRFRADRARVPKGIAGVGALVPLAFELLVRRHGASLVDLVRCLSRNPAEAAGLFPRKGAIRPGADADLVAVSLDGPSRAIRSSESDAWETWTGWTSTWDVRRVWVRGRPVAIDNELETDVPPPGESLSHPSARGGSHRR